MTNSTSIRHTSSEHERPRVVIIGSAAAGKSTLTLQLSELLDVRAIELDDLNWLPDWQSRATPEFRALVDEATRDESAGWVVAGNYSSCRDILWQRAETLIWLDYDFWLVLGRLLRRTFRRWWTAEQLFGGTNTEQLSKIFSRDSLIWWMIKTWRRRKREYPLAFLRPEHAHLQVLHMTDPTQTDHLLATLTAQIRAHHDQMMGDSSFG